MVGLLSCFFFVKQKTAYEMRISDWSSDVCSSDLATNEAGRQPCGLVGGKDFLHHGQPGQAGIGDQQRPLPAEVPAGLQIGRASCRERVCQYVSISVVAVSLKKQTVTVYHTLNQRLITHSLAQIIHDNSYYR